PRTQGHQVAPEAPCSEQETRSILDSLIAGQAAHDLQIKHLMEMLSSSRPLASHVSVCQLCRKAHPGKVKGKKTQEEAQVSAELHGLRDITAPHGFDGTVHSKLSRDQPPIRVCKKCNKLGRKGPAGSAGADLPRTSHSDGLQETPQHHPTTTRCQWCGAFQQTGARRSMEWGKRLPPSNQRWCPLLQAQQGFRKLERKQLGVPTVLLQSHHRPPELGHHPLQGTKFQFSNRS
ncbi:hypothetical protein G0U57_017738, partial [Chelydra serpentina]